MDPRLQARLGQRYRLERTLGQGGMGSVFLALDTKLNRHVAIKSLHAATLANAAHTPMLERFRIEAEATAQLRHPHIVQVLDVDLAAPPFMVLEALTGESLRVRLQKEPVLSPPRACMIMTQVLSALGAAHAANIVHRDIKPANIFLVETPPPGVFAKVLDFGVARLLGANRMTQAGQSVGTELYMSPEQHRGLEVTAQSDLFACGLMLYEMLSGRRPFLGRTHEESTYLMLSGTTPAPIPNCPPELMLVVQRAIALDPARRFPTASAMMEALTPFVPRLTYVASPAQGVQPTEVQLRTHAGGTQTHAHFPTDVVAKAVQPARKRALLVLGVGVLLLGTLGAGAWTLIAMQPERGTKGPILGCVKKTCPAGLGVCGLQDDGCGGKLDCGGCAMPNQVCREGRCCTPLTSRLCTAGYDCGLRSNACGGTYDCGACTVGSCMKANEFYARCECHPTPAYDVECRSRGKKTGWNCPKTVAESKQRCTQLRSGPKDDIVCCD